MTQLSDFITKARAALSEQDEYEAKKLRKEALEMSRKLRLADFWEGEE